MESFQRLSNASNVLLMLAGFFLLNMQLHGYQHSTYVEEFPFNEDAHTHVHEDWEYELSLIHISEPTRLPSISVAGVWV